ncbi:LysR family transcriptional regulator [Klebsiella variicola]|nr:LysR family transcriptional regulator [Klebsiella variicola]
MTLQKNGAENKENIRIAFIYTMGEYVVPQLINHILFHLNVTTLLFLLLRGHR